MISTPAFLPMLVHKESDYYTTRKYLRKFNQAEIRGNIASNYQSLVDYLPFDFRNNTASYNFFKSLTEMHRELSKYFKVTISLSAIDAAGTRTSLVETYTLNECDNDDIDYAVTEERIEDDEPTAGPSTADSPPPRTRQQKKKSKRTHRTHSTEAQFLYHQPESTQLELNGITPLDPSFSYRILYKLTDRHEIATGSGISFILTGPNLHQSLQADLRGPYFEDVVEDHDNNTLQDPLRYQLYKFETEHPPGLLRQGPSEQNVQESPLHHQSRGIG